MRKDERKEKRERRGEMSGSKMHMCRKYWSKRKEKLKTTEE